MPKKPDSTSALVAVLKALDPLEDTDKQWVLNSAASKWALKVDATLGGSGGSGTRGAGGGANDPDAQAAISKKDPRAFMRVKRPETDVQRVACIGYYLAQTTGNHGFSSKDLGTTYTLSGGSKINLPRALDNATRKAKYLSNRGPREKQLTTLGEDIVEALPDQSAVRELEVAAKGGRGKGKGRSKKKTTKKA